VHRDAEVQDGAQVDAWRDRFDRMTLLRNFCGTEFEQVREEFLGCVVRADHTSVAKVYCCIGTKPMRYAVQQHAADGAARRR
jgi:hypothetical protein